MLEKVWRDLQYGIDQGFECVLQIFPDALSKRGKQSTHAGANEEVSIVKAERLGVAVQLSYLIPEEADLVVHSRRKLMLVWGRNL